MTDDSLTIEIDGNSYLFRLEDQDVREGSDGIEKYVSLFVAFHPASRSYDKAALFLWKGLRKRAKDGNGFVYIFPQDETGKEPAFQYVKKFCSKYPLGLGLVLLYGYFNKALVANGWCTDPDVPKESSQPKEQNSSEETPPKN